MVNNHMHCDAFAQRLLCRVRYWRRVVAVLSTFPRGGTSGLVFRLAPGSDGRDSHMHWPRVLAWVPYRRFVRLLLPVPAWPPLVA